MSNNIQAVILCGGLGTRLRPLTYTIPKPLAPVNNFPFLHYLILQFYNQGCRKFLLLLGYKSDQIVDYFENHTFSDAHFEFSIGPSSWPTGRRVYEARNLIDDKFFLLYSDNYVHCDITSLHSSHAMQDKPLSLIVHPKKPGNIKLDHNSTVQSYSLVRDNSFEWVELGYMVVNKKPFFNYLIKEESLSSTLHNLAINQLINCYKGPGFYFSISDQARLDITNEFFSPKKIILLDRDGTLNVRPPRGEYISHPNQLKLLAPTINLLSSLSKHGFKFIVISNQACIERNIVPESQVELINLHLKSTLQQLQIEILDFYVCPHHWDSNCLCRKPAPGMLYKASVDYNIRLDHTIYIGDDVRDIEAASNAYCNSIHIKPQSSTFHRLHSPPLSISSGIESMLNPILDFFESNTLSS